MNNRLFLNIVVCVVFLLLNSQANSQTTIKSPYISSDLAFFELKGRVKSVTIYWGDALELGEGVTHRFSRTGVLQGEEAESVEYGYNPFGYTRDENGRIDGVGNGHSIWKWKNNLPYSLYFCHMDEEFTDVFIYNEKAKLIGYKRNGKTYKYTYNTHDAQGNWISRLCPNGKYERRKIIYY